MFDAENSFNVSITDAIEETVGILAYRMLRRVLSALHAVLFYCHLQSFFYLQGVEAYSRDGFVQLYFRPHASSLLYSGIFSGLT